MKQKHRNRRKGFFLSSAYIFLTVVTVMLVVQKQLTHDYIMTNTPWEPSVERSLYLQNVGVEDENGRREYLFSGLRFAHALKELETPEAVTFYTWVRYTDEFINGRVFPIPFVATDATYWEVMKFRFVEGAPYTEEDVAQSRPLAVISEWAKAHYFPGETSVVGYPLEIEGHRFEVCGVVKNVPYSNLSTYGEFWLPYTAWNGKIHGSSTVNDPNNLAGLYVTQIVAHSPRELGKVYKECVALAESLKKDTSGGSQLIWYSFGNRGKVYLGLNATDDDYDMGYKDKVEGWLDTLWLLLIPLLALICLTYTLANEQSRSYAIRRVHGASKAKVALQLVGESARVLLVGILIGVLLGYLIVYLNPATYLPFGDVRAFRGAPWLPFSWRMLAKLCGAFLLFLFASTLLPLIKLYRSSITSALKGGDL